MKRDKEDNSCVIDFSKKIPKDKQAEGFIDLSKDFGTPRTEEERLEYIADIKNDIADTRLMCIDSLLRKQEEDCSETLTNFIKRRYSIYTTRDDVKSEIWLYKDGIYIPNGISAIKEIVREIIVNAYTPQRVNKVIAKIEADTYIDTDEFFFNSNVEELPVQNGVLNIKTKTLSDFTPDKIFFNKLPMKYLPDATCPTVNAFFKSIISEDTNINVLYELIGYCLHREHPIEKATMLVGGGRNGKTKLIDLVKEFIGFDNTCVVPLENMVNGDTAICELHNKMVNIAGDLDNTSLKKTGLFKDITGRGLIGAKRKYLRDLQFRSFAKNIFACNQLPKVYDTSDGFWDRWTLLEFPYKFVSQDVLDKATEEELKFFRLKDNDIIDKITTQPELSGLLNMALEALANLLEKGDFSYSKGTSEVKNTWIRKADSFAAFCMDSVEEDYDAVIIKRDLRSRFSKYCRAHKIKSASEVAIKIYLEDNFGAYSSKKEVNGTWENVFEGIKFKGEDEKTIKTYTTLERLRSGNEGELIEFGKEDYAELEELSAKGMVYSANGKDGTLLWGLMDR